MRNRVIELIVGIFMVLGLLGLVVLAFKVSGTAEFGSGGYYIVYANFDNIGDLKVRAPVRVSGVTVGRVANIMLDPTTFRARVTLQINKQFNHIPIDSSANILTEGLLGSNYISLMPGFEKNDLKNKNTIETTHSALILENLVGQLIYNLKDNAKGVEK